MASQDSDRCAIEGLSAAEVAERVADGRVNVNTDLKTKSVRELIIENTCTLFNLINLILTVLVVATGAWKNLTFLGIVVANTGIGIVQALRSKRMVDKLTLLAAKKAVAVRDGREVELDLDQIVLDDIVRLGRGDQIPADARVVSGECHVNESLLTGESNPIHKRPGDELMSGSFIDSGLTYARVIHVGADNYVARINNEAKYVKKVNSEIMNALNVIVRFASVIMVPLGLALFYSSLRGSYEGWAGVNPASPMGFVSWLLSGVADWTDVSAAILSTVGALLGMIPQGLVLLTSSVLAIATIRLARRRVLAQQLYCIETLARVDVLCLDKTGTITSGRMEVAGVYEARDGRAERVGGECGDATAVAASPVARALAGIAQATAADANETCTAVLAYAEACGIEAAHAVRTIPFNSAKKWSGAVLDDGAYVMGAAQFVLPAALFSVYERSVHVLASTCRVLAVASVDGFDDEGAIAGEVRLMGFVTIRDEIRSSAAETVRYFCEQGVTLNVISGDDPRTVSSIARHVGIPGADAFVDATTLVTPAQLDAAVDRYHVFGRVTPQQKRELVQALQRRGHTVAMTGDGVNDVLALKEADCSVAMAAGSDAARNVAEIVLVDNDFAAMPAVVAEGRRSINNLQRSAALFLTKTLFSMGLAAICIGLPPYPFQPVTMTLIGFFSHRLPQLRVGARAQPGARRGKLLDERVEALGACGGRRAHCRPAVHGRRPSVWMGGNLLSTMCLVSTCALGCAADLAHLATLHATARGRAYVLDRRDRHRRPGVPALFLGCTPGAGTGDRMRGRLGGQHRGFLGCRRSARRRGRRRSQSVSGLGRGVRVSGRGRGRRVHAEAAAHERAWRRVSSRVSARSRMMSGSARIPPRRPRRARRAPVTVARGGIA